MIRGAKDMTLIAYHNDQSIKDAILLQLQAHYDADQIVKGRYWEDGRGCAVGCTIYSDNYMDYETLFGIPVALAHLEDTSFEGMPNAIAMEWPIRFMKVIQPGQDLSLVSWKFLHWLLTDVSINPGINHPLVKDACAQAAQVILAISNGETPNIKAAEAALAARSAEARSAWSAEAAEAAEAAQAARSAELAESAGLAVSARSVARLAAAGKAAESAAYARMADKLIELIEAAPMATVTQETET